MIAYYCSCGYSTCDPRTAFLHRETTHVIRPLTRSEAIALGYQCPFSGSGIDKHWLEMDIAHGLTSLDSQ
jgi:hypothetical protein